MENETHTAISVSNDLFDLQAEFYELGGRFLGNSLALRHCFENGNEHYLCSLISDYLDYCSQFCKLSDRFADLISLQQDLLKANYAKAGA